MSLSCGLGQLPFTPSLAPCHALSAQRRVAGVLATCRPALVSSGCAPPSSDWAYHRVELFERRRPGLVPLHLERVRLDDLMVCRARAESPRAKRVCERLRRGTSVWRGNLTCVDCSVRPLVRSGAQIYGRPR